MGEAFSAADIVVFPGIQQLLRVLERREAEDLRARLLPLETNFPAIAAWIKRVEALPGYEKTYPPHWARKLRARSDCACRNSRGSEGADRAQTSIS